VNRFVIGPAVLNNNAEDSDSEAGGPLGPGNEEEEEEEEENYYETSGSPLLLLLLLECIQ
jgi:hypothetical protein